MCDVLRDLRAAVDALDPRATAEQAVASFDFFAEIERMAAVGRTMSAARVAETRAWRTSGQRTPAEWVASRTKTPLPQAIAALQTASALRSLPATREQFVAGALSEAQAAAITSAATVDPDAERSLLEAAPTESVAGLRRRCSDVRAAAFGDEDAVERIRRGRYLRHWTDRDGAVRLDGRFAPDDGARLLAVVDAGAATRQEQARRSGQRERAEAYAADALVALVDGDVARAVVHVDVSEEALRRGHVEPGEVSRIRGVGPVPVAVARRLAAAGELKVIAREGVDVTKVTHVGRTIPAHLRTALEARDPECVVPGCDVRLGLEIDHITPFAQGGPTALHNLARLCRFHHAQKTHHGWMLGGAPGHRNWTRDAGGRARGP